MRITVVNGDRSVEVRVKGSSPEVMKEAEALATRLLTTPNAEVVPKPPIGFGVQVKEVAPDGGADTD